MFQNTLLYLRTETNSWLRFVLVTGTKDEIEKNSHMSPFWMKQWSPGPGWTLQAIVQKKLDKIVLD